MATLKSYKFVLFRGKGKEWRFRFVARNGETIITSSEGYKRKRDAKRAITLLQVCAFTAKVKEA